MRACVPAIVLLVTLAFVACPAFSATVCPASGANYPQFDNNAELYRGAIEKVSTFERSNQKLSGIIVPHHLLADELVALVKKTLDDTWATLKQEGRLG